MNIKAGMELIIDITGLGHKGEGVGRNDGVAVFVPGALPGEKVKVRLIKVKKNFCRGELVEILDSASDRAEPFCHVDNECGGCQLQHLSYNSQLQWKQQLVAESIKRIGKLQDVEVLPTIGMDKPFEFRNKVQLHTEKNKLTLGFFQAKSKQVVALNTCGVWAQEFDSVLRSLNRILDKLAGNNRGNAELNRALKHIVFRQGTGGQVMVIFVAKTKHPLFNELANILVKDNQLVKSVYLNVNPKPEQVTLAGKFKLLAGMPHLKIELLGLNFLVSPNSFFQVNTRQTEVLYQNAKEFAGLTGEETVLDAYCGTGTIALYLAKSAKKVVGIEVVAEAIKDAKENSRMNDIDNAEFIVGRVEELLPVMVEDGFRPNVVVLDPPRSGCDRRVLDAIAAAKPERIVYVSCDVGTLSRDLAILNELGFEVCVAQPVDMFPHTSHVECVVLMSRVDK